MTKKKLKIGLIVDTTTVSKYIFDIVEWAAAQDNLVISHLILQSNEDRVLSSNKLQIAISIYRTRGITALFSRVLWYLIGAAERWKLSLSCSSYFEQYDLSAFVKNVILVRPIKSKSGFLYEYSKSDIHGIQKENLDVLIRCGSGILRGDILTCVPLGVLSFHHADNLINRGGPPGFWEVYNKEPRTGFVIQQLTEELDGGHILCRGFFPTTAYYLSNQANLFSRSNFYMKKLLSNIAEKGKLPEFEEGLPYDGILLKAPSLLVQVKYISQQVCRLMREAFFKLLNWRGRWAIAYQLKPWRELVMWRSRRVPNLPGRFFADPFVVSKDGINYCFVEDFDYARGKGCISVLNLGDTQSEFLGKVIKEDFHLSFPYIFEFNNSLYMVPETSEKKEIRVYECVQFPLQWKLKSVLMRNVSAADTVIFKKDDIWWLMANINPIDSSDHCSELSVFYSTNPLSESWSPHALNPIYVDPSKARNGGLIIEGDDVYRIAQKYGFLQYGKGFKIFKINKIDPETYCESELVEIEPKFFEKISGTHHFHSNGQVTVFDYAKYGPIN